MNTKRSNMAFLIVMVISCSSIFFSSCKERSIEGMVIFTEVAGDLQDIDHITGNSWRYFSQSRIVLFSANKSGEQIKILTENFFSACSPKISYDGNFMLFAAQKELNEIWQIWEMNLEDLEVRQVTSSIENCIDPAYLPGKRLVFSKFSNNDTVNEGHSLYTCNLDGSEVRQITFNPHTYFASTVLKDGRILTINKRLYPTQGERMMMALRPDGSKQELFYKGLRGSELISRGHETNDGKVLFIESDNKDMDGGNIISVRYNRPLNSTVNLSSDIKGDFYSISSQQSGKSLVSYRRSKNDRYALYEFDTKNKSLGQVIYKDNDYNILEVIAVEKKERPKKLPSEVDMNINTGLLLCQDINFFDIRSEENPNSKASRIEVMGMDSSLGTVDVEEDGSFYLKILADTPFRIQTMDENGNVVNGPGSWLYLRPNERRGCVGCHENNEQVPENRQPLSIKKDPIILPNQMKEIH